MIFYPVDKDFRLSTEVFGSAIGTGDEKENTPFLLCSKDVALNGVKLLGGTYKIRLYNQVAEQQFTQAINIRINNRYWLETSACSIVKVFPKGTVIEHNECKMYYVERISDQQQPELDEGGVLVYLKMRNQEMTFLKWDLNTQTGTRNYYIKGAPCWELVTWDGSCKNELFY